jgi:hypothetical protein
MIRCALQIKTKMNVAIVFIMLLMYWTFECYIMSPLYINNFRILSHVKLHSVFICSCSLMAAAVLLYVPCLEVNCSCEDIVYFNSENKTYIN